MQFYKMKRIMRIDGSDDCTAIWIYLIPMNCTFKDGWDVKCYVMCILPPK